MTVNEALQSGQNRLEAEILLAHTLGKNRPWLIAHKDDMLSMSKQRLFLQCIKRRTHHEPLAYLLGTQNFCGTSFIVNKHVLIPRPETEALVDFAVETYTAHLSDQSNIVVWDVGTGSGAIAVSVKHLLPHAIVIASDISKRALGVARRNAIRILDPNSHLHFFTGSLLSKNIQTFLIQERPDHLIVLANLPYLPLSDKTVLEKTVVDFEPHLALFTKKDGNALIITFLKQCARFLQTYSIQTMIYLECDAPQIYTLTKVAAHLFPHATVAMKKDCFGRERFIQIMIASQAQQT